MWWSKAQGEILGKALSAASRINEENFNLISEIMLLENEQRNVFQTAGEEKWKGNQTP